MLVQVCNCPADTKAKSERLEGWGGVAQVDDNVGFACVCVCAGEKEEYSNRQDDSLAGTGERG